MLKFLFWNVSSKQLKRSAADLALQEDVDFVLLAEAAGSATEILLELNRVQSLYFLIPSYEARVTIFVKFHPMFVHHVYDSRTLLISKVKLPIFDEFLLATVHLPSKLYASSESLQMESQEIAHIIREREQAANHERTILLGDLNQNPFEPSVVGAGGFHAVMSRQIAEANQRTVQGRRYPFFYNPMWNHLGDEGLAAGTYFYRASEQVCYFWNIFDQVLIRPSLLKYLPSGGVKIITSIGSENLLNYSGIPNKIDFSDHLPIVVTLDI